MTIETFLKPYDLFTNQFNSILYGIFIYAEELGFEELSSDENSIYLSEISISVAPVNKRLVLQRIVTNSYFVEYLIKWGDSKDCLARATIREIGRNPYWKPFHAGDWIKVIKSFEPKIKSIRESKRKKEILKKELEKQQAYCLDTVKFDF